MKGHRQSPIVREKASSEGFFIMLNAFREGNQLSKNKGIRASFKGSARPIHNRAGKLQRQCSKGTRAA
jgi:hypothetical protein